MKKNLGFLRKKLLSPAMITETRWLLFRSVFLIILKSASIRLVELLSLLFDRCCCRCYFIDVVFVVVVVCRMLAQLINECWMPWYQNYRHYFLSRMAEEFLFLDISNQPNWSFTSKTDKPSSVLDDFFEYDFNGSLIGLSSFQTLLKKHEAFESDLEVHQQRVSDIKNVGEKLITEVMLQPL